MSESAAASEPEARYVSVNDLSYALADGCARTSRKCLLRTDRMVIHQTSIRGPGQAEDYGVCDTTRTAYVLSGTAALRSEDPEEHDVAIARGQLIIIPSGTAWGKQLSLHSDELVLLEVTSAVATTAAASAGRLAVVDPDAVTAYEPAGHHKTRNRCLFVDAHMELIEGLIDRGGGAERHSHRDHEQVLYLLGESVHPLLIYYPKGTPHGTGGGIPEPLHLLVIYSPPLGESHNALA